MVGIDDETVIVGSCSSVDFSWHAFEIFKFAVKTYFIIDSTFKLEIKRVDINGREK